jgi:hypothetical protein
MTGKAVDSSAEDYDEAVDDEAGDDSEADDGKAWWASFHEADYEG